MRIEGHGHRGAAMLGCAAPHAFDDLEVAAVKAVEVAEREHGMHEPRRPRVVGKVKYFHAGYEASTSMSSTRPSYASSTPAGRRALVSACPRSCDIWVKYARRGPMRATASSASDTLKCVECGRHRSASITNVSTPATSGHASSA